MKRILTLATLPLLIACSTSDSSELSTSDIGASIEIHASERHDSEARVYLSDDFADVALTGGDRLTLTTDRQSERDFVFDELAGVYQLRIEDDTAEATVSLLRPEKSSAMSQVIVPEPLAFVEAIDGSDVSLSDGTLTITWSNPIDGATIDVWDVACGGVGGSAGLLPSDPPDSGSVTIDLSRLSSGAGECVTLTITRTVVGEIASSLASDSRIEGIRDQSVDIMLLR